MTRRLTTIVSIDMVGSSRLMALKEAQTIDALRAVRTDIFFPRIAEFSGRLIKSTGDGAMVEFPSAVLAAECAVAVQRDLQGFRPEQAVDDRLWFRVGINIGDVVDVENDVLGDGVNVAAFLESLAPPGGIVLSRAAHDQIVGRVEARMTSLGKHAGKELPRPIEAWRMDVEGLATGVRRQSSDVGARPSIAVLPFQNMSSDPDQEFLVDGIVQDVITGLSRFGWLRVIARNSTFAYRDTVKDMRAIGRELGVRYIVVGSVRRAGERLRVTAEVVDADSGAQVWANRWDRVVADLFDLQDELTEAIVTGVAPELRAHERTMARKKPTHSLSAWELAQRGDPNHVMGGPVEYQEARECLKLAIEADPDFALPYALLSRFHSYALMVCRQKDREESIAKGVALAEKAISLDERGDEGHVSLALMLPFAERFEKAREAMETAIALNPNNPTHRHYRGWLGLTEDRPNLDGILADVNDAIRLSPTDHRFWQFHFLRGMARVFVEGPEGYDAALADFHKSMEGPLCDWMPFLFAAIVHGQRGDEARARAKLGVALKWHPALTVPILLDAQLAPRRPRYAELLAPLVPLGLPAG
ncbi:MAG: adenylate/guanylate cyclase domain-containing protein [Rubrimonas sp.]|uniref:adenylate/guanylate cyclase domain-containing protein n=1 Tax=Rubrimonas sp. TaxID=2036015 RepID=UPI002FDE29B2